MILFDNSLQESIFFSKSTIGDTKCLKYEISFDYFNLVKRFVLKNILLNSFLYFLFNFIIWVNEEDHIRIISMQKGASLKQVWGRLVKV